MNDGFIDSPVKSSKNDNSEIGLCNKSLKSLVLTLFQSILITEF